MAVEACGLVTEHVALLGIGKHVVHELMKNDNENVCYFSVIER